MRKRNAHLKNTHPACRMLHKSGGGGGGGGSGGGSISKGLAGYAKQVAGFDSADAAFNHFRNITSIPAKVADEFSKKFGGLDADGFPTKSMKDSFADFYKYSKKKYG